MPIRESDLIKFGGAEYYTADNPGPGRRPIPIPLTAAQRLDAALLPFIRPGTPVSFEPGSAAETLRRARFSCLVAAVKETAQ